MAEKIRLDILLVDRQLAETRNIAQRLIMAGQVRVDGQILDKPGTKASIDAQIEVDSGPPFVSRGGEKLTGALEAFPINVSNKICADVGASTGGFTDCLLQNGAAKVYAIEVGKGILHWKIRQDPRVVVMEGQNARHVESLPEMIDLAVVDASFISLKILLPVISNWFPDQTGDIIALIKPQFEAGKDQATKGKGVIKDPAIHRKVLEDILSFSEQIGFSTLGLIQSPLIGPKGNKEFLVWMAQPPPPQKTDVKRLINQALT